MLLSPGHSPRRLSSPSPSPADPEPNNPTTSSSSLSLPRNRAHRAKVLDEDAYVAAIERIIERDFFPDISKLRDRLDWLEALRSHDPLLIRDAQLKIIDRRRGAALARSAAADSDRRRTTLTPGSTFARSFTTTPFGEPDDKTEGVRVSEDPGDGGGVDPSLSLDEFFRRYTSEDNESFSKILEKVNRKRKERFGYLTEGEKEAQGAAAAIGDAKRDRITDGFGTSDQPPSTLESWNYTAKNLLMYHPADCGEAPLTEEERALRMKALEKEINRPNTRFRGHAVVDSRPKDDDEVVYAPVAGSTPVPMERVGDKGKKYDLDDLRRTPNPFYLESGKKAENGYSFVRTPSPAPGVEESPFITWGEIEGTPLRLETEDTPIDIGGSSDGPHYRIPHPPARDEKAHSLSREAAKKLRERSRMFQKPPLPSPARGGSATPRVRTLSPAAQKFVRNAIGKNPGDVDETLRASYRGASPGISTPKSGRSVSRLGRDNSNPRASRSPSVGEDSNLPW